MLVLKCLGGAIVGAIVGFIAFVVGFIAFVVGFMALSIIAGLILWDMKTGEVVAADLAVLFVPAGIIVGAMTPIWDETKRREAAKAKEVARVRHHEQEQQAFRSEMVVLGDQAMTCFESIPKHLATAEEHLDRAEVDFTDRAFAPFWDSIENAAKTLGRFDESVRRINNHSCRYTDLVKKYEDTPPEFPLRPQSVRKLDTGTATAQRMSAIVRKAQCDFQFATIYEQRKTNQILIAGFTNLAQALEGMTQQIVGSIDNLAGSVGAMTSILNESMQAIQSQLEVLSTEASERSERERQALEMLDNIQRHRRPLP